MRSLQVETLERYLLEIKSSDSLTREFLDECLPVLERFECWTQVFRAIARVSGSASKKYKIECLSTLARIQNICLEDPFSAAETCVKIVEDTNIGFKEFSDHVLPQVIGVEENYSAELTILASVENRFSEKIDVIFCLERLCFLLEKKVHNESQLARAYERLIALDPANSKALKYFKVVYTQNNEWEEVIGILQALVNCCVRPQEKFRYGQELASIYLYQLDMPDEAITIIDSYCSESPLDTSSIMYDAYQRLGNLNGCLRVLRECLLNVNDDKCIGVIHFKIAALHEQMGEIERALENYGLAVKLNPGLLDALEGLINILVSKRDWPELLRALNILSDRVDNDSRRHQIKYAINRLQSGIAHAQTKR